MAKHLLLYNIRSAYNVGSMFRTADGAGVARIYISGHTPTPTDRFGRVQEEIKKTSLGACDSVPWEAVEGDIVTFLTEQKNAGYTIVAIEQDPRAIPLKDFDVPENVLYIVGNEVDGVAPEVLDLADVIVEIPMRGMKESLNVSVALGVVLFSAGC